MIEIMAKSPCFQWFSDFLLAALSRPGLNSSLNIADFKCMRKRYRVDNLFTYNGVGGELHNVGPIDSGHLSYRVAIRKI